MNDTIIKQKALLQKALDTLQEIQSVQNLFGRVDPEYAKECIAEKQEEYAFIITDLTKQLCTDLGFELVPINSTAKLITVKNMEEAV